jgi:2,5-diketo-D-gluconate reductase A
MALLGPLALGMLPGMTSIPALMLADGHAIPQLGYGTYLVPPEKTAEAVRSALETGYRHIDTAEMYDNERGVGEGLRASGLARDEVYITSKLSNAWHLPDDARGAFDATLAELGSDHLDLFIIHWPLPTRYGGDFVSTWKVLEEFQRQSRTRSIGVSNFQIAHLERLARETGTVPAVNQIEVHPYFSNDEVRAYGQEHGIVTQAWSPLARGKVLSEPIVMGIAERLQRTPSQIVLRWHVQRGDVVFPKTMSATRMQENLDIFDFELEADDLEAINGLDQGEAGRIGPHPDTFDWIPG